MRRFAVIPVALLFGLGCWDFDSLSGGYVPPAVDASQPGDIACGLAPKQIKEDCTQNLDVNQNCLYGCDDPDCSDHIACFASKGYKTYGSVVDNGSKCGASPQTTIYKDLAALPANCNGSCAANSTTSCNSILHVYPTMGDCTAKTNDKPVNLATATNCPATAGAKDSAYIVDKPTAAGACTPKNATVPLNPSWGTTSVLCDQSASNISTFGDMKNNGIACVVFNGTDSAVCASTKLYTNATVYYQGTNGSVTCTCSANSSGACSLTDGGGNALVNLTDKNNCGAGGMLTTLKMENTCVQPKDGAMNTYMTSNVSYAIPAPTCNVAGAVSGSFTPKEGLTVCCM